MSFFDDLRNRWEDYSRSASSRPGLLNKPWVLPVLGVMLVLALGYIAVTLMSGGDVVELTSPRDQYIEQLVLKFREDERFGYLECQTSLEDENAVLVHGEVKSEADIAALNEYLATLPQDVKVEVQVELPPERD